MAQESVQRRLAAILAADMVGYSRLMGADAAGTVERQKVSRKQLIDPIISSHRGRVFKTTGDGFLVEFSSIVDAANCALAIQRDMVGKQRDAPMESRMSYRIGIHLGEVIEDEGDIFGDGVNVAARIEALAPPGGICVSDTVRENLRAQLNITFEDIGRQVLKNIDRKVQVWRWQGDAAATTKGSASDGLAQPVREQTTIAVLPFLILSSTTGHEHLADGITEDLTTGLSKIENLFVVSHVSALSYKGKAMRVTQIGQELGADYVIEGSVQTASNNVRVNIQLTETQSGGQLWAEKFDGSLEGILHFQDQITQRVVAVSEVRFSEGEQVRLWRDEAADARAYEHFLRGRALYKEYSRGSNSRARPEFRAAIAITPRFISAIVGLARTHLEDATFGWSANRAASLAEAKRLLDDAFSINDSHAAAHAELAHYYMVAHDYASAHEQGLIARALDPNSAEAQIVMAFNFLCLSQPKEALTAARNGIRLSPGVPESYLLVTADAQMMLQRFDEALPLLARILTRRPRWLMARAMATTCLEALGRHDEAHAMATEILELSPNFSVQRWRRCLHNPDRPDTAQSADMLKAAGIPA